VLPYARDIEIVSLLASPQHRFEGRPADGPLDATARELHDAIEVRAHLGIVGDRYFGHAAHRTASVTVFAIESLEHVAHALGTSPLDPADTRRNIVVRGLDIDGMRDERFTLDSGDGPVLFRAHRPASPCAWMDVTLGAGAHKAMRNRGGMRCEPLTSGVLRLGPAVARTEHAPAALALF
jgi:MOSC domain-containing protein YiiM